MGAMAKLVSILSLDTKPFEKSSKDVASKAGGMQSSIGGVFESMTGISLAGAGIGLAFVAGAVAVGKFAQATMQASADTKRLADASGVSSGFMSELGDMAEKTGVSAEGFQAKVAKLTENQEKAILGSKGQEEAFARLGISMSDLQTLAPDELLLRVAQGAQKSGSSMSDLNAVLGKGAGAEFGATLKELAENGLPAVADSTTTQINALAELNASWMSLKDQVGDYGRQALVVLGQGLGLIESDYALQQKAEAEAEKRHTASIRRSQELAQQRSKDIQAKRDAESAKGQEQIQAVKKDLEKSVLDITVSPAKASDRLSAIGGVVGFQQSKERGLIERQIKEQELLRKSSEKIEELTKATNKALEDVKLALTEGE